MTLLQQLRKPQEVKRWFDQIGDNAADLIECMQKALEAHERWFEAELEHQGTFQQRMELCCYAEWLTRQALARVRGESFTEEFQGVPRLILKPFSRDKEDDDPHQTTQTTQ